MKSRTGTTATPFQFVGTQGYYRDSASKTYVRARYLDTEKARWMTQDPIGFGGNDPNLFRYGSGNPINTTDPQGLQVVDTGQKPGCPATWCGFFAPRSDEGRVYIDCNCRGSNITILPDKGNIHTKPPCGKWISADAVIFGGRAYKVNGQTCSVLTCPPDDEYGCYAPRFCGLTCSTVAWFLGKCKEPYRVDFCQEFCGRPCPPPCRGYSP